VVSDNQILTQARLLLTDCVRIVLRNGLHILGVSAPAKM
jgi:arginyl-tRNA synthetase